MQSALEYANALSPKALIRSVTYASASLTRKVLFPPILPPQRPFRVSNSDRSRRKGVVASTLKELIEKAIETLFLTAGLVTLVLEEDGTVVDTEEFFQSLEDNTNFLILEGGQKWTQERKARRTAQQTKRKGIANITLDLYKLNPRDFLGCLNIKATFYEMYSVSCDIQCLGAKKILRNFVRLLSHLTQVAGHLLLYSGSFMMQWTEESEERTHRRTQMS
ncbi:PREDICTED: cell death activator CIDE-A [Nanorana parkeri]|uniref:cell death activator CIDE-A n=1 Tax=Nanorana parkeri TaxID=125878 RepID=UPI000854B612|nr:PREDICTED: cell death activator CIDE-A [Nanorana parkeri]